MPKDTFFNLDDDKRERVLQASITEYTEVPLEKVSIKKIVEAAGIPRGSFYQYFDDKEDLLRYLISVSRHQEKEIQDSELNESATVFDLIYFIFGKEISDLRQQKASVRLQMLNQISKSPRSMTIFNEELTQKVSQGHMFREFWERAGLTRLPEEDQKNIMSLLSSALKDTLITILQEGSDKEEASLLFRRKLEIIQAGINEVYHLDNEK
ncbi:MAG: TetR/AcrR family transcriptional regulator [Spirochaetales bacterium]|nr:TetR/AcrR family transcriptional regulator [Spirochaetales bacterium]